MIINANTKIASILKKNVHALTAIISISHKFEKLRNPLLRKVMAGRTTLEMAAKLGGCSVDDFYQKLEPLGFEIDRESKLIKDDRVPVPHFISLLEKERLKELDVRPLIASGSDPLHIILEKVKTIQPGEVLKVINSFEPTPLLLLLKKQGFETYTDTVTEDLIETYFYKTDDTGLVEVKTELSAANDWEVVMHIFSDNVQKIDVRHLEMPQPMLAILEALDHLPIETALHVCHKRIPVFLLPELAEKGFGYRIREITDGEVQLLIFKN